MAYLINLWKTEPVVIIGGVASILVLVAQQLLSNGIVTSANGINWLNFVISTVPLIAAALSRSKVSPTPDPAPPANG